MSSASVPVKRGALVGVILVSSALGASAMTVARCNVKQAGVYRPALLVEANGETTVHQIGENGLTRGTVFNEEAALAWASAYYGGSFSWNPRSSCNPKGDLSYVFSDDDNDDDPGGYLAP